MKKTKFPIEPQKLLNFVTILRLKVSYQLLNTKNEETKFAIEPQKLGQQRSGIQNKSILGIGIGI